MASKLSQILVLLALVAASTQKKARKDVLGLNDEELQNVVAHLKTHAQGSSADRAQDSAQDDLSNIPSLMNVETLNMYKFNVQPDGTISVQRARQEDRDDDEGRVCKPGERCGDNGARVCRPGERCGCGGGRCARASNEDIETSGEVGELLNQLENELDKQTLRCAGNRCRQCCQKGRCARCPPRKLGTRHQQRGKESRNSQSDLKSQLQKVGKTYKINDYLNAIVVDLSKNSKLVEKLFSTGLNEGNDDVLNYVLGDGRAPSYNDDRDVAETLVVDLDQGDAQKNLVNGVVNALFQGRNDDDEPVRPNELVDFYVKKKERIAGNALNFVTNSRGKKDLSHLSQEQIYRLQNLRAQVQRLGGRADLKELETAVLDIILGDGLRSTVLPHNENNNNVYVPNWVYNSVKSARDDLRRSKRLLPLTTRQKLKLFTKGGRSYIRRNLGNDVNDYGVPFQLQVQGLGQVEP